MRRTAWQGALLGLAAAIIAACGGGGGGSGNNPTLTIEKAPVASGDNQTATVGTALANNLRVLVSDDGDPQPGKTVTWATGNGTVTPTQSTTDQNGIATTTWTIGTTAGAQSMTASLGSAVGSPVTFVATGNAGPASSIVATAGNGQFTTANSAFAQGLGAKVSDQFGNGILGVVVTWTVTSGSALTASGTSVTSASGATTMAVTAGPTLGPVTITAAAAGVVTAADFDLGVVPAARQVSVGSDFFTSVTNGTTDPAVDTLVVGQAIHWTLVSGTHTVHSTGAPTFTSSGNLTGSGYTIQFPAAGTYSYNCSIHGNQMTGTIVVQ